MDILNQYMYRMFYIVYNICMGCGWLLLEVWSVMLGHAHVCRWPLTLFSWGSIKVLKHCLDRFVDFSSLHANPSKSDCFVWCSSLDLHAMLVMESNFRLGSLHVFYLGIPLISTKLLYSDYRLILDQVHSKVGS